MEVAKQALKMTDVELAATYATIALIGAIVIFALFKIQATIKIVSQMADDTLKRFDERGVLRWSRTSLTMAVAMVISVYMSIADFLHKGFDFEVFCVWLTVALGSKVTDAFSRKLDPSVQAPATDPATPAQ